jgi:hypothetical protein
MRDLVVMVDLLSMRRPKIWGRVWMWMTVLQAILVSGVLLNFDCGSARSEVLKGEWLM